MGHSNTRSIRDLSRRTTVTDRATDDRATDDRATDDRAPRTAASGDVPDPSTWRTGDEPPTERQAAYLETLAREAGEDVPDGITKAEASEKIDELRDETGRA
jgi:hypothetical protein